MLAEKNQNIKKAYDILQIISKDAKARMQYDAREAALRDERTRMKSEKNKGKAEGVVIGEAKGKAEAICQYLEVRFGAESQALQESVRAITDLETLSRIMNRIYIVTHLDEAMALIQSNLVSQ